MTTEDACFTCGKQAYTYGTDAEGYRHCYACCALLDKEAMRRDGRIDLYLSDQTPGVDRPKLSNWPSTFTITPTRIKRSKAMAFGHRIDRYDVWFEFEGTRWHGVNRGDNQICRCRRLS